MNISRRKLLILLPAATVAWEYVLADTPESSPNYNTTDHWWGMLLDITKCIGCGSCVRACQVENHVPDGYFRTWIERYVVRDWGFEHLSVDSPDGGKNGFPALTDDWANPFSYRRCATTVQTPHVPRSVPWARPLSARMAWSSSTRNTAWAAGIASRPAPTAAASLIRRQGRQKNAVCAITGLQKGSQRRVAKSAPQEHVNSQI